MSPLGAGSCYVLLYMGFNSPLVDVSTLYMICAGGRDDDVVISPIEPPTIEMLNWNPKTMSLWNVGFSSNRPNRHSSGFEHVLCDPGSKTILY